MPLFVSILSKIYANFMSILFSKCLYEICTFFKQRFDPRPLPLLKNVKKLQYWWSGASLIWALCLGVSDIILQIINCRYIGIFSSYWQIIDIKKCASNFIWSTELKTLFQKRERECFISQTNMKSTMKILQKVAQQYALKILDRKICSLLPSW